MTWKEQWHQLRTSPGMTAIIVVFGCILVALLIFHAGVSYGERQAFDRMHGVGPALLPGQFGFLPHGFIPEGHGAVGTISAVTLPTFTLEERDGDEESVLVGSTTIVQSASTSSTLEVGQAVIVIGEPEDAHQQIDAKLIRILPTP